MKTTGLNRKDRLNQFTLIEVLIAIFLTSVVIMGLYSSMIMARKLVVASRYRLEAERICFDRTRAMAQMNYEDLRNFQKDGEIPGLLIETLTPMCYVNAEVPTGSTSYSADISKMNGEIWTQVFNYEDSCKIEVSVRSRRPLFGDAEWVWETMVLYRYDHQ